MQDHEQVSGGEIEKEEYGVDVVLGEFWKNEECRKLLSEYLPQLEEVGNENMLKTVMGISLRIMSDYMSDVLTEDTLRSLDQKLKSIPVAGKDK